MANVKRKLPVKGGKSKPKTPKKPRGSGKFVKGSSGGSKTKGKNPDFKRKLDFAHAFKAAVSHDDIKAIAGKLIRQAKAGNVKAAKEVLDRCLGKPAQAISLTGAEGAPLIPTEILLLHREVQE